jgi:hypothetical protein
MAICFPAKDYLCNHPLKSNHQRGKLEKIAPSDLIVKYFVYFELRILNNSGD